MKNAHGNIYSYILKKYTYNARTEHVYIHEANRGRREKKKKLKTSTLLSGVVGRRRTDSTLYCLSLILRDRLNIEIVYLHFRYNLFRIFFSPPLIGPLARQLFLLHNFYNVVHPITTQRYRSLQTRVLLYNRYIPHPYAACSVHCAREYMCAAGVVAIVCFSRGL